MGGTDLEVHGRGGCGGDELILETDQLPKFRVLLEPVLQTCSKQEQLTVWSSSRLKSAPACGGGGLDVDFNGHFQTVRGWPSLLFREQPVVTWNVPHRWVEGSSVLFFGHHKTNGRPSPPPPIVPWGVHRFRAQRWCVSHWTLRMSRHCVIHLTPGSLTLFVSHAISSPQQRRSHSKTRKVRWGGVGGDSSSGPPQDFTRFGETHRDRGWSSADARPSRRSVGSSRCAGCRSECPAVGEHVISRCVCVCVCVYVCVCCVCMYVCAVCASMFRYACASPLERRLRLCADLSVYVCMYVCVCVCACVRSRSLSPWGRRWNPCTPLPPWSHPRPFSPAPPETETRLSASQTITWQIQTCPSVGSSTCTSKLEPDQKSRSAVVHLSFFHKYTLFVSKRFVTNWAELCLGK